MICCKCHKEISRTYGRVSDLGNYCKECAKQNEVKAAKLYEANIKKAIEYKEKLFKRANENSIFFGNCVITLADINDLFEEVCGNDEE